MPPHLKLFPAIETPDVDDFDDRLPEIRVRLRDLLPLVAMAQKRHFLWLQDFLDDEVAVSPDLNDVLSAFRSGSPKAPA